MYTRGGQRMNIICSRAYILRFKTANDIKSISIFRTTLYHYIFDNYPVELLGIAFKSTLADL